MIGVIADLISRVMRIGLRWHKINVIVFFNSGERRDFKAALFPGFNTRCDSIRNWLTVEHGLPFVYYK